MPIKYSIMVKKKMFNDRKLILAESNALMISADRSKARITKKEDILFFSLYSGIIYEEQLFYYHNYYYNYCYGFVIV